METKKETSCCPEASWGRLATEQPSSDDSTSCTTTNTATITSSCLLPSSSSSSSSTSTSTHSLVVGKQLSIGEETNTPIYYSPALPADLSLSKRKKKAIVIIPDVWGPSDRLKRLADSFSQRGYHAIIPDSFRGETKDSHPNFVEWVRKFTFEDVVKKDLEAVLKYLETECNISPEHDDIAIIGFCWGGWVIAKSASEGFPWKCGVSMHPATKLESVVFQRDETAMLEKVNMPWLLLPAGNDEENLKPGSAIVEKLREKGGDSIVFEKMVHGWVSRGDIGQAAVREDIDKALDLTVKFIEKNLS